MLLQLSDISIVLYVSCLAFITCSEMDSTLSELGLSNRQALIVVPQKQNNSQYRGVSSRNQNQSSNEAGSSSASEGYWGSVKRILSYANVFSYLGRSDSTSVAQESQSGMWQYSKHTNTPGCQ